MKNNTTYTKTSFDYCYPVKDTKALVKDLQLQIDYLIGYSSSGNHWKQEYHIRKTLLDEVLSNENTPPNIVEKIGRIQNSIYRLQNDIQEEKQPYSQIDLEDYKIKRQVPVSHYGKFEYYIEL